MKVPIGEKDGWTCTNKARIARYLIDAQQILDRNVGGHITKTARDLTRFQRQWERYVESGYSQYPWEVLLTAACSSTRRPGSPRVIS